MSKEEYIRIITQVVESPRSDIQKIHRLEEAFNMYVRDTIHPQGIDKDRLIEEMERRAEFYCSLDGGYKLLLDAEKLLEWVNQQPTSDGWIPVSSGEFPKIDEAVLCFRGNHIGELQYVYVYKGEDKWEDSYGYYQTTEEEGITAWQPLPPAYKENNDVL